MYVNFKKIFIFLILFFVQFGTAMLPDKSKTALSNDDVSLVPRQLVIDPNEHTLYPQNEHDAYSWFARQYNIETEDLISLLSFGPISLVPIHLSNSCWNLWLSIFNTDPEYMKYYYHGFKSPKETRLDYYARLRKVHISHVSVTFAIKITGSDNAISFAGMTSMGPINESKTEIAHAVIKEFSGRGIATMADALTIRSVVILRQRNVPPFNGITELYATVHPNNAASICILKKFFTTHTEGYTQSDNDLLRRDKFSVKFEELKEEELTKIMEDKFKK
jgi:RimJ/RimL family protein N-acetyltransferase